MHVHISGNSLQKMAQMTEVLSDKVLLKISQRVDLATVDAKSFSVILGFKPEEGSNAQIRALVMQNPKAALHDLLQKYVNKHGTGTVSALNLRTILRENELVPAAECLEEELRKLHIPYTDPPVTLPSPPMEDPASPTTRKDSKQTEAAT